MTTQQMFKTVCPPGYWFENTANVDQPQDWELRVVPYTSPFLFGYAPEVLLAKQFK